MDPSIEVWNQLLLRMNWKRVLYFTTKWRHESEDIQFAKERHLNSLWKDVLERDLGEGSAAWELVYKPIVAWWRSRDPAAPINYLGLGLLIRASLRFVAATVSSMTPAIVDVMDLFKLPGTTVMTKEGNMLKSATHSVWLMSVPLGRAEDAMSSSFHWPFVFWHDVNPPLVDHHLHLHVDTTTWLEEDWQLFKLHLFSRSCNAFIELTDGAIPKCTNDNITMRLENEDVVVSLRKALEEKRDATLKVFYTPNEFASVTPGTRLAQVSAFNLRICIAFVVSKGRFSIDPIQSGLVRLDIIRMMRAILATRLLITGNKIVQQRLEEHIATLIDYQMVWTTDGLGDAVLLRARWLRYLEAAVHRYEFYPGTMPPATVRKWHDDVETLFINSKLRHPHVSSIDFSEFPWYLPLILGWKPRPPFGHLLERGKTKWAEYLVLGNWKSEEMSFMFFSLKPRMDKFVAAFRHSFIDVDRSYGGRELHYDKKRPAYYRTDPDDEEETGALNDLDLERKGTVFDALMVMALR